MNSLVTGVTGLIGSNIAKQLVAQGDTVIGIGIDKMQHDVLSSFGVKNKIIYAEGDIRDRRFLERVINTYEVDRVLHLAALSIVRSCEAMPLSALDINVMGTGSVLETCRQSRFVKSVVMMSSDKSYGQAEELPYKEETTPLRGLRTYEASKSLCDLWGQMYGKNYGLPVAIVRACNAYGKGDFNFSRLVPGSIKRFLNGERPVIWEDVKGYKREFIYVEDLATAIINLSDYMIVANSSDYGEAFNIGTKCIYTIEDFINLIREVGGFEQEVIIQKKHLDFHEIPLQYLDSNKIKNKNIWDFVKSKTKQDIGSTLRETINWYKDFLNK